MSSHLHQILHLLPSIAEGAAGLAAAVKGLANAQHLQGQQAQVLGADAFPGFRRAAQLVSAAQSKAPPAHLVHSHGLWLAASCASRRLHRLGLPTVVAPHGMLDPWAWRRHRAQKQLLWWLGERTTVQGASCLQALCTSERDAIRALGITAPIALIPNGVELPDASPRSRRRCPAALAGPWRASGAPVLLFLGRHTRRASNRSGRLAAQQCAPARPGWCWPAWRWRRPGSAPWPAPSPACGLSALPRRDQGQCLRPCGWLRAALLQRRLPMAALRRWDGGYRACSPRPAICPRPLQYRRLERPDPAILGPQLAVGCRRRKLILRLWPPWVLPAAPSLSKNSAVPGRRTNVRLYAWLLGEADRPEFVER